MNTWPFSTAPVAHSRRAHSLRIAVTVFIAAGLAQRSISALQAPNAALQDRREPVLVELFTSEGCSDCPQADALLAQLDAKQFVPGADAIVLSEHVTYWNRQGWRDRFSFTAIDQRQQEYAHMLGLNDVYTPQVVVDGAEQFVGSDLNKLTAALQRESMKPKVELRIENAHRQPDGSVEFSVRIPAGSKGDLIAVLAENATVSEVARGENAGRTLHHVAVVRVLKRFSSSAADGRPLELKGAGLNQAESQLRLVVFLAGRGSLRVLGAAEQILRPPSPAISAR